MPSIDTLPVLLTKIQPPPRRVDGLRRARLLDPLLEHVDRKLLLVIAPAGYGKTTLLADLVDYAPMPVAWLALDGGDRDPRGFVEYLVHALRRQFAGFGGATLAALNAGSEIEQAVTALARAFAADVQQHVPQVSLLVLDDFHEVNESRTVTSFLDEALRLLPDNLRIVLAGRSLPRLTISRLAVADQLFGLGEAELRFEADEVEELIRVRYGVELPRERAEQLTERAEGWITGVLLSTRGIWDGVLDRLVHAEGLQGALYGYLEDEAFTRHPHQLREFLLASSVLAVVDPASCEALLGPGDWLDLLQRAEQASLFIARLGGPQIAFRYHQLFRDFLEARLRRDRPEQFRSLHARAARHRAAGKDWVAALHHARA